MRRSARTSVRTVQSTRRSNAPRPNNRPQAVSPALAYGRLAAARQTKPKNWTPYVAGGLGIIPRRGMDDPRMLWTREKLAAFTQNNPMKLLALLPDLHPSVGLALWNALRLTCAPDGMKLVAVPPGDNGADATKVDEKATAQIEALWKAQPPEIGGLQGLQTTLTIHALFAGLPATEAVPGKPLEGVRRVWPVDSLTLWFGRDDVDGDLVPYQKQRWQDSDAKLGYKRLNPQTFFWRALDNFADEAYGRAAYAPALAEVLCDLALMQDLRDCLHNSAWPRLGFGFNFPETYKTAVEIFGMDDETKAANWVQEQFELAVQNSQSMKADDNVVYDSSGDLKIIEGGKGLGSLEKVLTFLRQRIIQALKSLPTLMGINDGSTQTYSTVEWSLYAAGLETVRGLVAGILEEVATLHLRLLGLPFVAKAQYAKIRTTDALLEAQTEATLIANTIAKRQQGWITNDQAAMERTGNVAVADPIPDMPATGGEAGIGQSGTTQEERDANKGKG